MNTLVIPTGADAGVAFNSARPKAAASWGAIIAGALVAISTTLILLPLGSGLGLASVSPWADHGVSATTFTITAAIWFIVMQWISSAMGGYIAGRLRTRWIGTHGHEIFFRDTAHGLVTWSLATVVVAVVVAGSVSSGLGGVFHAASGMVAGGAQGAMSQAGHAMPGSEYGVDKLFRPAAAAGTSGATSGGVSGPGAAGSARDARLEVGRILTNGVSSGSVPDADRAYLVQLVAMQTGISTDEAQHRVDELISNAAAAEAKVKAEADAARKAAAEASIYTALSLLVGAFIASVSAALGGRLRDEHV